MSKRARLPDPRHLADHCIRGRFRAPLWNEPSTLAAFVADFAEAMTEAVVIEASNVAEYFYAGTPQEEWSFADFPCVAPPYSTMFIEMGRPSRIVSEVSGVTPSNRLPWRWGTLIRATDGDPLGRFGGMQPRWTLRIDMVEQEGPDEPVDGPLLRWLVGVDESGSIIDGLTETTASAFHVERHPELRDAFQGLAPFLWPALLTLSFMHCRNVSLAENGPPARLQAFRRKTGRRPLFDWVTLDIEPMKQVLPHEGRVGDVGLQRALHRCRGHFKDYRGGRGLFGKLHGLYFFGDAERGNATVGVRGKDYRIAQVPDAVDDRGEIDVELERQGP